MDARWNEDLPNEHFETSGQYEPRRSTRHAVELSCELVSHYGDAPESRKCTDVSQLGMWIETDMPLHPGSELVVGFRPPAFEGPELLVFATVTRVRTGRKKSDRGTIGMGVEFRDLSRTESAILGDCLAGLERRATPTCFAA
ncbi:MAG: PilZ domain-containing protein [Myxococcales bacterium]|nr:PilZ domain-containing protein [Myxococcales bacterium]